MMSLVAARAPSLIIFGTLQTAMWTWVFTRYQRPAAPLPSHIPKGFVGKSRFQQPQGAYAYST